MVKGTACEWLPLAVPPGAATVRHRRARVRTGKAAGTALIGLARPQFTLLKSSGNAREASDAGEECSGLKRPADGAAAWRRTQRRGEWARRAKQAPQGLSGRALLLRGALWQAEAAGEPWARWCASDEPICSSPCGSALGSSSRRRRRRPWVPPPPRHRLCAVPSSLSPRALVRCRLPGVHGLCQAP